MQRVIWQYWETKTHKPPFVDGLHALAKRNSGVDVILVTPETLPRFLASVPSDLSRIDELAHKADMIRAMLLHEHGGMWLDSDAIVLRDLTWLFDALPGHTFVGFTDDGTLSEEKCDVRINCFLAPPQSPVIRDWMNAQHAKFPKVVYGWTEIGTDLLGPIALRYAADIKLFSFERICPIRWNEVRKFSSIWADSRGILDSADIVMLNSTILHESRSSLTRKPLEVIASRQSLVGDILRRAYDPSYVPPSLPVKLLRLLVGYPTRRLA